MKTRHHWTLAAVFVLSVLLPGGGVLRAEGEEKGAAGWESKFVGRPVPGQGPLALGPEGYFWGVTTIGRDMPGYLYKMKPDGSDWQILHTFRPEGSRTVSIWPQGTVVFDGVDSMLGCTMGGVSSANHGTLYKVNVQTGVLTTLVEFTGKEGPHLGTRPSAPLVPDGLGSFWGSTSYGGKNDMGTIFKYHLATGMLTTVVEMPAAPDPEIQDPGLQNALTSDGKGWWWGTTSFGGKEHDGTIFKVKADTGELTTVVEFTKKRDGKGPGGGLVSDGRGFLWGTCLAGGQQYGTVFKVDATTGVLTTVLEFTWNSGSNLGGYSQATLVDDGQGFLWGSTPDGGRGRNGTLFKVDIASGALTTMVEFHHDQSRQKGRWPSRALVNDGHGALLGTTDYGGAKDAGTVFKVDVKTGVLTTLVEFGKVGP